MISGVNLAVKKDAAVESTVGEWKVFLASLPPAYAASNTANAVARDGGNTDWRGFYRGYNYNPLPFPGDTFDFIGSIDGTKGFFGPAICDRLIITCDVFRGRKIESRVDFSANGAGTLTADAAVVADASNVVGVTSVRRTVALNEVDATLLRYWRLIFTAANKPYVHSGTDGKTQRTSGLIDVAWLYQVFTDDPTTLPARGTFPRMRFYVTDTLYWLVNWGRLDHVEEFGASKESPENVGATIRGSFSGYMGSGEGTIIDPAGGVRWP